MNQNAGFSNKLLFLIIAILLFGCKVDVNKSSDKEITSYWFTSSKNATLSETIKCSISNTDITCSTPYGTDVTGLIATFQQTGEKVRVGNTEQTSGSTANDFSSSVTYTVIAEDDSTQEYEVTVNVAAASDKTINSFEFLAENNTALSNDVTGTVYENNHTIGASVPSGTDVTALCPTIGYSGDSVSPGNEVDTDFSNAVTYTVTAADGTTQDYEATVTVLAATADTEAPTNPSISINSGASSTSSTTVTLTLSAEDNLGVVAYYASESSTTPSAETSGWVSVTSAASYSDDVSFTLSSGTATKTVYVWFKDNAGNISSSANDAIALNDLADGLIAYYPFNGNANDESGNGNDGTLNGPTATTDRDGNANSAYSFDGTDDYITITSGSTSLFSNTTSTRTVSCWFKNVATPGGGDRREIIAEVTASGHFEFNLYSSTFDLYIYDTGWKNVQKAFSSTNQWTHFVGIIQPTDTIALYVDSTFIGEKSIATLGISGGYRGIVIGGGHLGPSFAFDGAIDDIRIYNRTLSTSEIEALYNE